MADYMFKQYIDGEWCEASNGGTWNVLNPATEEVVCTVPYGNGVDCSRAIAAAAKAFPEWSRQTPYVRAEILMKAAALIKQRIDDIFIYNTSESGKTIADAKGDLMAAALLFEWFAEEGKRAYGRTIPSRKPNKRLMVLKQPLGVVGTITAWNFPAYNPARCWAAALAAGCTIVGRPSEYTPLTAMILVNILVEAGIPKGVINLISGDPASMGQEMLKNPKCAKISFTGSTRVGRLLMDGASKTMTRLSLECGGNAPVIIFPDADMNLVLENAAMAKVRNVGQVCISPQRFLVHSKMKDQLVEKLSTSFAKLKIGNGADPTTELGPLINSIQRDRVEALVSSSVGNGAQLETGGKRPEHLPKGYFYQPTVVSGVKQDNPLFNQEIFGPVLPVTEFSDVDEVIAYANKTEYGLAAYVFTESLKTATRVYEQLEFGMVAVNDWAASCIEGPFPGWKQSGIGAECGQEGLEEYLETKLVGIGNL